MEEGPDVLPVGFGAATRGTRASPLGMLSACDEAAQTMVGVLELG